MCIDGTKVNDVRHVIYTFWRYSVMMDDSVPLKNADPDRDQSVYP